MGETIYEFTFNGTKDTFLQKVHSWRTTTPEGERYRVKNPPPNSILKLQRGSGFLTAPIILEVYVRKKTDDVTEINVRAYVKSFLLFEQSLSADAKMGAIPRRNGWKDMEKLLQFLGINQYNHHNM